MVGVVEEMKSWNLEMPRSSSGSDGDLLCLMGVLNLIVFNPESKGRCQDNAMKKKRSRMQMDVVLFSSPTSRNNRGSSAVLQHHRE